MRDDSRDAAERAKERKALFPRYGRTVLWRRRLQTHVRGLARTAMVMLVSGTKRVVDFLVALALLALFSPVLLLGYLLSGLSFQRTPRLGRWCSPFHELSFDTTKRPAGPLLERIGLSRLPVLINIVRGDMSFVGPLPASPGDLNPVERSMHRRYHVRPGLISPWWIRQRANIDYMNQWEADAEYVENQSLLGDIGVALRAIPAILYGSGVRTTPDALTVLGIPINNLTMAEALDTILGWVDTDGARQVCFVNADCANIAYRDDAYFQVLRKADLCLADGIGLKLAGKVLGRDIKQNVNGTDLFPKLCEALSGRPGGLFLLGARDGVAEGVAEWVRTHFPEVRVCGWQHGYFLPEDEQAVIRRIEDSGARVLLVAFGAPRQDMWIEDHLKDTGIRVAMGVGGLFDFYSGRISRAPLWMREMGMEWVYRLVQEPGRLWKRYLVGNGLFLWRVLVERLRGRERGTKGSSA
jgi:N-acetylglucosaminyldiphosphoundecaprenol N-acetyl-beta-D-mannosaminyltransferase